MPISYPISQPVASATSNTANYIKYAVGVFSENSQIDLSQAYTASYDAAAWLFAISSSVPSSTTMSIAIPTSSYVSYGAGASAPQLFVPALEFWRTDQQNVKVLLSSSNPDVVFGYNSLSTFEVPTSSYTNIVQIDEGFGSGGQLRYVVLEQSALP